MLKNSHRTWVEVSKVALENNTKIIKRLLKPETKLMAVVKSNAYGHGLVGSAKLFLKYGADWLGVFSFNEALELRKNKITKPILVLGPTDSGDFSKAIKQDIGVSIMTQDALGKVLPELKIHIKVDTGLSRQGFLWNQFDIVLATLRNRRITPEGIFTHLADAQSDDTSLSQEQFQRFKEITEKVQTFGFKDVMRHMLAADGLLTFPQGEFDMVRAGIALYGLPLTAPWQDKFDQLGFVPVLSWKTRVTEIKQIDKLSYVGYDKSEQVKRDTRIAIIPVGYWDGYARSLSSKAYVVVRGKRCRLLGRVSMNMIIIDVSDISNIAAGDICTLIGRENGATITATELAELADTINYEIVTRINPLIPRIFI